VSKKESNRISNERKNLTRLAGEFLVASRLSQEGFMVSLQWGTTIGYDILVFDKNQRVAYLEIKTSASHKKGWALQKKYADPSRDKISADRRFVCCVDMKSDKRNPTMYIFPSLVVAEALHYGYGGKFSKSPTYSLQLDSYPRGRDKSLESKRVGDYINAERYRDNYDILNIDRLTG